MQALDDLESPHAAAVAQEALQLLAELNIPVIPSNFSVWFTYVLGRSDALRRTIDILRSNKRSFDKTVNRELYGTFLRYNSLLHAGQSMQEELGFILRNVKDNLSEAIHDNGLHASGLSQIAATLEGNNSELALQQLSHELVLATERASSLEAKLAAASDELDQLRAALEQAEVNSKTDALTGL